MRGEGRRGGARGTSASRVESHTCHTLSPLPPSPSHPLLLLLLEERLEGGCGVARVRVALPERSLAARERLPQQHLRLVQAAYLHEQDPQVGGRGKHRGVPAREHAALGLEAPAVVRLRFVETPAPLQEACKVVERSERAGVLSPQRAPDALELAPP